MVRQNTIMMRAYGEEDHTLHGAQEASRERKLLGTRYKGLPPVTYFLQFLQNLPNTTTNWEPSIQYMSLLGEHFVSNP
jgi:hypothetical protein